jgi:methylated-DNA-[protein]-cysteine S-methyltransferase
MEQHHYHVFEAALGPCGIAWNTRGVTRLQLPMKDCAITEKRLAARSGAVPAREPPAEIAQVVRDLQRYFAGERVDFTSVAVDLENRVPFHALVQQALRSVGWGRTTTYGALATQVGAPNEAREVGQAMAHNPVPVIIPCHRVLAAGNSPGGFSAYGGVFTKERLLALEGVYFGVQGDAPLLPGILMPQRNPT